MKPSALVSNRLAATPATLLPNLRRIGDRYCDRQPDLLNHHGNVAWQPGQLNRAADVLALNRWLILAGA